MADDQAPRTAADVVMECLIDDRYGLTVVMGRELLGSDRFADVYLAAERIEIALRGHGLLRDPDEITGITDEDARAAADLLIRKGWITIT